MPIHTYTNWNKRQSDNKEQIEPFRKYFSIIHSLFKIWQSIPIIIIVFNLANSISNRLFLTK